MPEIDTDLFQLLALAGLALVLIVGLAILAAVGRTRRALEKAIAEPSREWTPVSQEPQYHEPPAGELTAASAEMPDAADAEPEPAEQTQPVATAAPAEASGTEPGVVSAEQLTPEPEVSGAASVQTAEPRAATEPEPVEGAAAVGAASEAADEPEEQPFQRGGRWWFRRGDELLIYDDDTGQWQQAPPEEGPGARAQGIPTTLGDVGRAETGVEEEPVEEEEQGSFWKCPSCGAVNGSTAASCRMCFTAKP